MDPAKLVRQASSRRRESFADVTLKPSEFGSAIKTCATNDAMIKEDTTESTVVSLEESISEFPLNEEPAPVPAPKRATFIELMRQASMKGESFADVKLKPSTWEDNTTTATCAPGTSPLQEEEEEEESKFSIVGLKKPQTKQAPMPSVKELTEKPICGTYTPMASHRDSCIVVEHEGGAYVVDTKVPKQGKPGFANVKLNPSGLADRVLTETLAVKQAQEKKEEGRVRAKKRWGLVRAAVVTNYSAKE